MNQNKLSTMSIKEIKEYLHCLQGEMEPNLETLLAADVRAGVQQLLKQFHQQKARALREKERLNKLSQYETALWRQGCQYVAGIDEAGRGPLAGPVVAAAVILPEGCLINGVNDSKQLSPAQREKLYPEIKAHALGVGVGIIEAGEIDRINILQATLKAMRQAVRELPGQVQYLLIDALTIPGVTVPQRKIIKGDSLSISIAAASIIAKVTRDHLMAEYDKQYPAYGFRHNSGYGTAEHLTALLKYGPCAIHRRSFAPVKELCAGEWHRTDCKEY